MLLRFQRGFGDHLGPCWRPLDPKVIIFHNLSVFVLLEFFYRFFNRFWDPGSPKNELGRTMACPLAPG